MAFIFLSFKFIERCGFYNLIIQIYVDEFFFVRYNFSLCENFINHMKGEIEMCIMGELTFFLGHQIKKSSCGTFISQSKYNKELVKKFGHEKGKAFGTPMSPSTCLETDAPRKDVDEKIVSGNDWLSVIFY